MSRYALSLLGTWQVQADGESVTNFRGDKVRALLAYLAVEQDRPHPRSRLAGLFWPDRPDDLGGRNLSQGLVRLRQALGVSPGTDADPLSVSRQAIQWRSEAGLVDVVEFTRLAAGGELPDLEEAAALYRGEFLTGFELPDCDEFEEWLLVNRERLKELALGVLDEVAERKLEAGRPADAGRAARRQLELDPWREAGHRHLIHALAASGDRAAPLAAYGRCCEVLRADLGTEPDDETRHLAERIEAGEVMRALPGQSASSAAVERDSLPAPLSALVGREGELARLTELLEGGQRLLTVVGAGAWARPDSPSLWPGPFGHTFVTGSGG